MVQGGFGPLASFKSLRHNVPIDRRHTLSSLPKDKIIDLAIQAGLLNYVDNETPRRYFIPGYADHGEVIEFANLLLKETENDSRIQTP